MRLLDAYHDRTTAIREHATALRNLTSVIKEGLQINIHVYHHFDDQSPIVGKLDRLEGLLQTIRQEAKAMHAEAKQLVTELNEATNAVAARIDKLISDATGGMTKDEATEHVASLTVLRDGLRAMGANPADPLPPLPPE